MRSPLRAQMWLEWRESGETFSFQMTGVLVAMAFSGALILILGRDDMGYDGIVRMLMLNSSVFYVINRMGNKKETLSTFAMLRPISTAQLVDARMSMIAIHALISSVLIAAIAPMSLWLTGWTVVVRMVSGFPFVLLSPQTVAVHFLTFVPFLFVFIWNVATGVYVLGKWKKMGVRVGVAVGCVVFCMAIGVRVALVLYLGWVSPEYRDKPLMAIASIAILGKVVATAWAVRAATKSGLRGAGDIGRLLGLWFLIAASLIAGANYLLPEGNLREYVFFAEWTKYLFNGADLPTRYFLSAGVVLALPLARLIAAPAVLARCRHR